MSNIIEVENLSFGYRSQNTILKDISFEVKAGTFLAIAGPNGAGKTTLLNLLCGLLKPKAGSIEIDTAHIESYSVKKLAQKAAVVRQEFVPVFDFTVAEIVAMARTPYLGTFGFESKSDKKLVNDALKITDTICFAERPLAHLSGGERQRVFIARALAQNTAILLLDEPTSFLDLKHQVGIYDLLKAAQLEQGKTIVAVTHDINLAAQYADVTLLLGADSSYQYGLTKDVFSPEQIEKVFSVKTFSGKVGQEKFFIPLGKFAKDSRQINSNRQK
jgi:iron complex transport system ATP-binding protein